MSQFGSGISIIVKKSFLAVLLFCSAWVCGYKLTPRIKQCLLPSTSEYERLIAFCDKFKGAPLTHSPDAWYAQSHPLLWAHAGGGHLAFYTNSKESIDESIRRGYKVIEVDVSLTSDNVPVLSHNFAPSGVKAFPDRPTFDEFMRTPICGKWTPLSLKDLFVLYADYDVIFSIDPHLENFDLIGYMECNASKEFLRRCIYQIYTVADFERLAIDNPFGALHYCVNERFLEGGDVSQLIKMLTSLKVNSVSFGERHISKEIVDIVGNFRGEGIAVSIALVNTIERFKEWWAIGANCFDTDLLTPDDLRLELIGND